MHEYIRWCPREKRWWRPRVYLIPSNRDMAILIPKEMDVKTAGGKWYTVRMAPYRTPENVVEGVVATFADVTDMVQTRVEPARARGHILAWNPAAERECRWTEAEALEMNLRSLLPEDRRAETLAGPRRLAEATVATMLHEDSGTAVAIAITERTTRLRERPA
jgi:hypothetical protein